MPYPNIEYLYQNKLFVVKSNQKARLSHYDFQEKEAQEMCYQYIKSFRVGLDVGCRYGGWARNLGSKFQHIHAFEPREKWRYLFP